MSEAFAGALEIESAMDLGVLVRAALQEYESRSMVMVRVVREVEPQDAHRAYEVRPAAASLEVNS